MPIIDWADSMQQTFEFYKVNPITWYDEEQIKSITNANIERNKNDSSIVHGTIDGIDISGEFYVRIYLVVIQNKVKYREPLATLLIQTSNLKYDGKKKTISVDAYSPLIELKENMPDIGFYIPNDENLMNVVIDYAKKNMRAPVLQKNISSDVISETTGFVANFDDTWMSYITSLISEIGFEFDVDALGRVSFTPSQDISSMQPIYTYNDDNSSILYPEISTSYDLYSIPNVVEVLYSTSSDYYLARATNEDAGSPTSTQSRGRTILYRTTSPDSVTMTKQQLDEYAQKLLENLSTIECKITYKHGYNGIRLGDCVMINYQKSGLKKVKAVVISQSISCTNGCPVTETAIFTTNLMKGGLYVDF